MRQIKVTNKSGSSQIVDTGRRFLFAVGEIKVLPEDFRDTFDSLPYFDVERIVLEGQATSPEPVEEEEVATEPVVEAEAMPEAEEVAEVEVTPEAETPIEGIAPVNQLTSGELFRICFDNEIIADNGGAWRSFHDVKAQGADNFIAKIENNNELREQLIDELINI